MRKPLVAGNWKMNKTTGEAVALTSGLVTELAGFAAADALLCPPFTALAAVGERGFSACGAEQDGGAGFVGNVETGRHVSFEREAREQSFAEGVDSLDFEAPWRLERLREQGTGAGEISAAGA